VNCRESEIGNQSSRGYVESIINSVTHEVRFNLLDGNSQIQKVQKTTGLEILRINNAINNLETKIRAEVANNSMIAVQKYAADRTTNLGLTESINGRLASDIRSQIVTGMNEVNICYVSTCGDSINVTNPSLNSYINNANSGPGFDTNTIDLRHLILPKITDSANQVQLYFIQGPDY